MTERSLAPRARSRRGAVRSVCALLLGGCAARAPARPEAAPGAVRSGASDGAPRSAPSERAPAAAAARGGLPPLPPPSGELVPALPGAASYRGGAALPPPPPAADALIAALRAALPRALAPAGTPPPALDARLDAIAAELARLGDAATLSVQQFLAAHHGVVEPDLGLQVFRIGAQPDDAAVRRVVEAVRGALNGLSAPQAFGAACFRAGDELRVAVVTLDHLLDLEPVPRRLAAGGRVTLRGRLRPGLAQPEAVVQTPGGRLGRVPVKAARPAGTFTVDFRCAEGAGTYQIELLATGAEGVVVVANFPLHCGVEPPARLALSPPRAGARVADPVELEDALLALCQGARARAGLPALRRDPALVEVARAHSREMARAGQVAHRLPHTGVAPDRLRAAGIAARVVMENVGAQSAYRDEGAGAGHDGASAEELHEGFMASPGHRAGILSPLVTHAGFGVVRAVQGEAPVYYVTQLFVAY